MSKVANSIRRGLKDAVAYAKGEAEASRYRVHVPEQIDGRPVCAKLAMTPEEFATRLGFTVNTLRRWDECCCSSNAGRRCLFNVAGV